MLDREIFGSQPSRVSPFTGRFGVPSATTKSERHGRNALAPRVAAIAVARRQPALSPLASGPRGWTAGRRASRPDERPHVFGETSHRYTLPLQIRTAAIS